jgi:anaerobic selenocysteine-containing dehydrogenase
MEVTVEERACKRVAIKVAGSQAHGPTAGVLCTKVSKYLERTYHPDRLLHPLKRVGRKGEGRFEPITWDEALTEIAERFHGIIADHGAEAIMPFASAGNQSSLSLFFGDRFWHRLGASTLSGALCGLTAGAGAAITNGTGRALDPSELRHSKLILLWGTNTRLTNRHLWPIIEEARAAGAQVVVIDPIRTMTAESADWFLQPLPGTDIALMLAMMHVLVRDGLTDAANVAAHTHGFDELAAHVADWTPERAATVCGLDVTDIETLARMYGTMRPTGIRTLIGAEHHEHGAMFFRTLTCLPALVGAWRDRGAVAAHEAHDEGLEVGARVREALAQRVVEGDLGDEVADRVRVDARKEVRE